MEAYEGTGMTPQIETSDNTFQVILPNLNTMPEPARQMQVNPSFIQFFFRLKGDEKIIEKRNALYYINELSEAGIKERGFWK